MPTDGKELSCSNIGIGIGIGIVVLLVDGFLQIQCRLMVWSYLVVICALPEQNHIARPTNY